MKFLAIALIIAGIAAFGSVVALVVEDIRIMRLVIKYEKRRQDNEKLRNGDV